MQFIPGHFFVAQCSYIRRLLPPKEYMNKLRELLQISYLSGLFNYTLYPIDELHIGWDRYGLEHWIASHPSLQACDLSPAPNIKAWHLLFPTVLDYMAYDMKQFQWSLAPRYKYDDMEFHIHNRVERMALLSNEAQRRKEWFLLPGILFRHFHLYGHVPPHDSWYWDWYPDGDYWRTQFESYTNNPKLHNNIENGTISEFWTLLLTSNTTNLVI
jgi:hypothetical protein